MKFLQYALSLSPSVLSLPIMGHLNTYDGYNRSVTVNGSPQWRNPTNRGFGLFPQASGHYYIAHGAEQIGWTDQTIFVFYSYSTPAPSINTYEISKYNVLGRAWAVRRITNDYIYIYNNPGSSQNSGIVFLGNISFAIKTIGSASVDYYYDGVHVATDAGLDFSTQPLADIHIGNVFSGVANSQAPIECAAIFPSALTDEQISNLHLLFSQMVVGYQPKTKLYIPRVDTKGAVLDIWGDPNQNNIIADKSGNSNDGTVSGRVSTVNTGEDIIQDFYGAGEGAINCGSDASIDNITAKTIGIGLDNLKSAGESTSGRLVDKGVYFLIHDGIRYNYYHYFSGATARWRWTVGLGENHFTQLTYDDSDIANVPTLYINGVEVTRLLVTSPVGSSNDDSADNLVIGNRNAGDRALDAQIGQTKIHPTILSADDLRDEYLKFALGHVRRLTPRFEHPVTLASVAAPGRAGPWRIAVGNAQWLDNGTKRGCYIDTVGDVCSVPSNQAYGAWYADFEKDSAASWMSWLFCASRPNQNYQGADQTGYVTIIRPTGEFQLYRMNGGGITKLAEQAAGYVPSTGRIQQFITRNVADGEFNVWIKDTTHTTWTLALTVTDTNYTTSNNQAIYEPGFNGAWRAFNLLCFPYGDSLEPNDIPEIAD